MLQIRVDHRGSSLSLKAGEGLLGRGLDGSLESGGRVDDPSSVLVEEAAGDEAETKTDLASRQMRNQVTYWRRGVRRK